MGLFTPNQPEIGLVRSFPLESFSQWGVKSKLYLVQKEETDIHDDKTITYEDPVNLHILLEEAQLIRVLKNNGWFVENTNELPLVAYIPYKYLPTKECMIEVNNQVPNDQYKKYLISEVAFDRVGSHWICKLVPYRSQRDYDPTTDEVETSVNKPEDLNDLTFIPGIRI